MEKKFAIRHEDGRWLKDASGYTPQFTHWLNKRREFINRQDAERAHQKCVFLLQTCRIVVIENGGGQ